MGFRVRTPSNDFKALFFLLLGFYYDLTGLSSSSIATMEELEFHLWDDEYGKLKPAMKCWNGAMEATAEMEDKEMIKVFGWLLGKFMEVIEVFEVIERW
nr:hypothetical protein [Tanacetum cinerariifolium]